MEPVLLVLPLRSQVHDERDAVVDERLPARLGQPRERIGADDDAVRRLAAPGERQPTEVADIDATVPAQNAPPAPVTMTARATMSSAARQTAWAKSRSTS